MKTQPKAPHWPVEALEDMVEILDRQRVPVSAAERAKRPGEVPYYGATGQVDTIDTALFDEPLVLLGEDGVGFLDPLASKAYLIDGPAWVNNHAHVLRVSEDIDRRFLFHWLNSFDYRGFVNGTTRLKLTQGSMKKMPVPVPPLDEQHAIVETIERMLSHLDAASTSFLSGTRRLEPLRRSVLVEALWLHGEGAEGALPENWSTQTIGEIAEVRLGRQRSPKNHAGDEMQPYLRAANVDWYQLRPADIQQMNFTNDEMNTYALRENDILVVEGSGSATEVGKCALVPEHFAGHAFQNTLIRVRPGCSVDPRWLMYRINAEAELGRFRKLARGSGIFHLGSTRTSKWPLAVPPLEEQRAQADRVAAGISRMRHLSASLDSSTVHAAPLRHSILKAAFEGRLTRHTATSLTQNSKEASA